MLSPWDSPGKNSGVDFYVFLQRIFLTQGSNLCLFCLLYWQAGSLLLVPPGFQNLIKARQFPQRHWGFPGGLDSKESACNAETGFNSLVGKIPWRRKWHPIPLFLPGEFHGQRNMAGYSPWGPKESGMTKQLKLLLIIIMSTNIISKNI